MTLMAPLNWVDTMAKRQNLAKRAAHTARDSQREVAEVGTRTRLLLAAERVIAEAGVSQASMRKINAEAGARNLSAAHYHFGSLDGLIAAVLEHRTRPIAIRRLMMLREMAACGRQKFLIADVLRAVVWPLAELLICDEECHYVGFLAAVHHRREINIWKLAGYHGRRGLMRCYVKLRRILDFLPADVLHIRITTELRAMVYVLADVAQVIRDQPPHLREAFVHYHVSELVTRIGASLSAPVSESTESARRLLMNNLVHAEEGCTRPSGGRHGYTQ